MTARALDASIAIPASYQPKSRRCLRCENSFVSSWFGHRICQVCKKSAQWRGGATPWSD